MNDKLTLEQVAKFPRPGMAGIPTKIGFTPDNQNVTFLQAEGESLVLQLWIYDLKTGTLRKLIEPPASVQDESNLSQDEKLRRERTRLREVGVTSYQFATNSEQQILLVPLGSKLFVKQGDDSLTELAGTEGAVDPTLSPDGKWVAFVRDSDLCVIPTRGGNVYKITSIGDKDGSVTFGLAEYVAQEEMDRSEGFWWSPDSQSIAYEAVYNYNVPKYVINHLGGNEPSIETHLYPFPGKANAAVSLFVASLTQQDIDTSRESGHGLSKNYPVKLTNEKDFYLARVAWKPDGSITAQIESRDQHTLQLKTFPKIQEEGEVLVEEHADPWINLNHDTRFLKSGEILWASERTGFAHLYLLDENGHTIRTLTTGEWQVINVVALDEPRRLVYFNATKDSVLERHLYVVSLEGGEIKRITQEPGWHTTTFSSDCNYFVDSFSNLQQPPKVILYQSQGEPVATLFENVQIQENPSYPSLRKPELFTFENREGITLHAAVYTPPQMEKGKRYPLIVSVYGGPHAQMVMNNWSMTVDLRAQYLTEQGFVVLKVDNRGSANRGLAFEGFIQGNMGHLEVDDQVDGVRYLINQGYIDPDRVGIYGWSYGGYMTVMSLLLAPDIFKAGVAGAPVTDWYGYDTHYTERYMQLPAVNTEGYRNSSALSYVDNLQGKLLLVHGLIDENVHFRHTARLIDALTAAQKDYDLIIFPEERHMPRNAKGLEYLERRLTEYFLKNL